jgi:hypothetical protein
VELNLDNPIFGCTTVRDVWQETEAWQLVSNYIDTTSGFGSMVFNMLETIDDESMAKILMMFWTLWWRRNQKCYNDKIPTIFDITRRARETLHDWLGAQSFTWSIPRRGSLKGNIDIACYVNENTYCTRMCIRDNHGRFVKAREENGRHIRHCRSSRCL